MIEWVDIVGQKRSVPKNPPETLYRKRDLTETKVQGMIILLYMTGAAYE